MSVACAGGFWPSGAAIYEYAQQLSLLRGTRTAFSYTVVITFRLSCDYLSSPTHPLLGFLSLFIFFTFWLSLHWCVYYFSFFRHSTYELQMTWLTLLGKKTEWKAIAYCSSVSGVSKFSSGFVFETTVCSNGMIVLISQMSECLPTEAKPLHSTVGIVWRY